MNLIAEHPTACGIAAYWIFSALVGGMPDLCETSSPGYTWLYNSLHLLAGNISSAMAQKYPQLPPGANQTTTIKSVTQVPKE